MLQNKRSCEPWIRSIMKGSPSPLGLITKYPFIYSGRDSDPTPPSNAVVKNQ